MSRRLLPVILRIPALLRFLPYYLVLMAKSNIRVACDALRAKPRFHPGFVEVDVKGYGPLQKWTAACLISMTPGTLSIDLSDETGILLVHTLYLEDLEAVHGELNELIRRGLGEPRGGQK